ncbi:MAG: FKBP-type peptidyl-prolyl cis-trans isomerase, partial [Bacteroidetes bacterium]|nr:FKBP-type peptidyl-prolyl cis-trans isomerase [Bacteroidota bacterium]
MIKAKGNGAQVEKENYVYVRYAELDFNENYLAMSSNLINASTICSTEEHLAKQMGLYSPAIYYGPVLSFRGQTWMAGINTLYEGLDEVLLTMKEGDKRRIWLPSWLSSYGYIGSSPAKSATQVYDVEVVKVVSDIEQFQIDSLESYRDKYYPGIDSLSYGFYKKTLKEGTGDTLKNGNKVNIWYVGRLLDGYIFDTNMADTAKKYDLYGRIYSNGTLRPYEVMTGECKEEGVFEATDSDGSSGSVVSGFSKAIFNMKHGEEAVVFFYSGLGYQDKHDSDDNQIQPFSPLVFYLKVERIDSDEEEGGGGDTTP